jgi:hypothetical protein
MSPDQGWRALDCRGPPMKILARLITHQLGFEANKLGHCAIYEKELQRVWPIDAKDRKEKIAQFAKHHGFCLAYYRHGF